MAALNKQAVDLLVQQRADLYAVNLHRQDEILRLTEKINAFRAEIEKAGASLDALDRAIQILDSESA